MREMKDSGIEWIGEIPKDWNCCKQKYKIKLINGRAYKDTEFEEDGKYRILRVGNLFSNPTWYYSSLELEKDKYCEKGDLLYSWSMSYGPHIWNGEKVIYHYHIWKTKLDESLKKRFAYYYYMALSESIRSESHETTMGFVTMGIMNNSYIAYPNVVEQQRIADYLDEKCAKIDSVIEKQQVIIEKLKEYKLSVITEAVTKGLNPDVEMRDSNIKWIGSIPRHWSVSKMKYQGKFINGFAFPSDSFCASGIRVMKIANIQPMHIDWSDESFVQDYTLEKMLEYKVCKNDLVFALTRPIISGGIKVAIADFEEDVLLNQRNAMFKGGKSITSKWQYYLMQNQMFVQEFALYIDGTGQQPNISTNEIANIPIPIPSLDEQERITNYLDNKMRIIDMKIEYISEIKVKLEEYKKSLIYEVVTGKREV